MEKDEDVKQNFFFCSNGSGEGNIYKKNPQNLFKLNSLKQFKDSPGIYL